MLPFMKLTYATIAVTSLLTIATIASPFTRVFGKYYFSKKDFICCRKNQLILHHYFALKVFWITVADGYTEEPTGKASANGCDIMCNE